MKKHKKAIVIKLIGLAAIVGSPIIATVSCSQEADVLIKIFQTTDIHGYMVDTSSSDEATFQYRLAYIANQVDQARNDKKYNDVLLLDNGDIYQGQIISNYTKGSALRAALDLMHYDATVLGNHEFDWGLEVNCKDGGYVEGYQLNNEYSTSNLSIPILAANIYDKGTKNRCKYTKDYTVVNKANKKIALIGYVPDYSADILAERIAPYDIDKDLDRFNEKIKEINSREKPDATIVCAHGDPRPLANKFNKKDVQLVTGGHDHSFKSDVDKQTGIPFIQGGWFGQGFAQATIKFDARTKEVSIQEQNTVNITEKKDQLYDNETNKNNFNKQILALSHAAWSITKPEVEKPVGYITQSIEKKGKISEDGTATTAGNWITSLYKKAMNVDIAFYNTGGVRTSFVVENAIPLTITYGSIYTMLPFNNPLLIYEFNGKQLQQQLINGLIEGNFGDQMTGLTFKYREIAKNQYEILEMKLDNGKIIDPNDKTTKYTVCLTKYSATLKGSVAENMQPINNEQTTLVESDAVIHVLEDQRGITDPTNFKIEVDMNPRGIKVVE